MKTRIIALVAMLFAFVPMNSHAAPPTSQELKKTIDTVHFKHAWKIQPFFDGWEFISTFKAPIPFSMKGEAEAVMNIGTPPDKMSPGTTMEKIFPDEIKGIQNELRVTEYLEKDHKPVNNIVSYTEKVGDKEIGILQYRIRGEKNDPPAMPQSIKQVLFVKGEALYRDARRSLCRA